jgi:hypothetical protein
MPSTVILYRLSPWFTAFKLPESSSEKQVCGVIHPFLVLVAMTTCLGAMSSSIWLLWCAIRWCYLGSTAYQGQWSLNMAIKLNVSRSIGSRSVTFKTTSLRFWLFAENETTRSSSDPSFHWSCGSCPQFRNSSCGSWYGSPWRIPSRGPCFRLILFSGTLAAWFCWYCSLQLEKC